jgi:hypothetical protein
MSTLEMITEAAKELPPDRRQELLDFAEFLRLRTAGKRPLKSAEGLWADLGIDITAEDIDEARREMWGNPERDV